MKKKIIVAGHICLDITPIFPSKKVNHLNEILSPGKLIEMGAADVHTGGAVANTGLAMKFLGADVSLMGMVGDDPFGDMISNILKKHNAEGGMLITKEEATSYSVILAVPGIDRIFLHNPGANNIFRAKDIPKEALKEAIMFHFGYPPLMRLMYENDGIELIQMMRNAKEAGVITSLDMAAVDPSSKAGQADWEKILEQVIPYLDCFMPSVEELCFMLDKNRYFEWQERAGNRDITEILSIEKDVKPLAEQCMQFGAKILFIKCGALGIYYQTADKLSLWDIRNKLGLDLNDWASQVGFEKSYIPERILSGTGAGDTSIAAFLTAMLKGYSLEDAMKLATATGASCVATYDALSGLKTFKELEEKINAGWKKNKERG